MLQMLCRNRVADFAHWKRLFDENLPAATAAGYHLLQRWQALEDPNTVYFLFRIDDTARALAFLNAPESAETGRRAGVIEGEYHFLTVVD